MTILCVLLRLIWLLPPPGRVMYLGIFLVLVLASHPLVLTFVQYFISDLLVRHGLAQNQAPLAILVSLKVKGRLLSLHLGVLRWLLLL